VDSVAPPLVQRKVEQDTLNICSNHLIDQRKLSGDLIEPSITKRVRNLIDEKHFPAKLPINVHYPYYGKGKNSEEQCEKNYNKIIPFFLCKLKGWTKEVSCEIIHC
jgi:hypothetical protein